MQIFKYDAKKEDDHPHEGYETHPLSGREMLFNQTIYLMSVVYSECPICKRPLHSVRITVPISRAEGAYWKCCSCGMHYWSLPSRRLKALTRDNPYANGFNFNQTWRIKNYLQMRGRFHNTKNAQVMILLKNAQHPRQEKAIIISDNNSCDDNQICVMDYKTEATRDILTQIFHDKIGNIRLKDGDYHVYGAVEKGSDMDVQCPGRLLRDIVIKKAGGYTASTIDENNERDHNFDIISVMMYSPYKKRYELTYATHDKEEDYYFMDASIYKAFVMDYGNPGIHLFVDSGISERVALSALSDESLLHIFGYNVGVSDGLTDAERQDILAFIIDIGMKTSRQITIFLENLVRMHGSQRRNRLACDKWKRDIDFVIGYKVNPDRFIFAK